MSHAWRLLLLRSWLSWIWWPWIGSNLDGVDGKGENVLYGGNTGNKAGIMKYIMPWRTTSKPKLNRASNKPHAVICDGSAMQRVPGSLRYLSKICQEANVGLYILNDPRSWGSQTHSTLDNALPDMRKAISENIIRNALINKHINVNILSICLQTCLLT